MRKPGIILIIIGLVILFMIFGPVIVSELTYQADKIVGNQYTLDSDSFYTPARVKQIVPVNTNFSLIIPKINLNQPVFSQIDSNNPEIYLPVLKKGVAQAYGSAFPNEKTGNVFIFGHSTDAFYNITRYNAAFYLLNKLSIGDEINLYYQNQRYQYEIFHKAIVSPEELESYNHNMTINQRTITLQTCYPPGTTFKRLLVFGRFLLVAD